MGRIHGAGVMSRHPTFYQNQILIDSLLKKRKTAPIPEPSPGGAVSTGCSQEPTWVDTASSNLQRHLIPLGRFTLFLCYGLCFLFFFFLDNLVFWLLSPLLVSKHISVCTPRWSHQLGLKGPCKSSRGTTAGI